MAPYPSSSRTRAVPVSMSQTCTRPEASMTTRRPSGKNSTEWTGKSPATRFARTSPVRESQTRTIPPSLPDATRRPSGEKVNTQISAALRVGQRHRLAGGRIPDPDRAVAEPGGEPTAVGRERHDPAPIRPLDPGQFAPGLGVPESRRPAKRPEGEPASVRREGDPVDGVVAPPETPQLGPGLGVPEPGFGFVLLDPDRPRGHVAAVGRECHAPDGEVSTGPIDPGEVGAGLRVPEDHRTALVRGRDAASVGRECQACETRALSAEDDLPRPAEWLGGRADGAEPGGVHRTSFPLRPPAFQEGREPRDGEVPGPAPGRGIVMPRRLRAVVPPPPVPQALEQGRRMAGEEHGVEPQGLSEQPQVRPGGMAGGHPVHGPGEVHGQIEDQPGLGLGLEEGQFPEQTRQAVPLPGLEPLPGKLVDLPDVRGPRRRGGAVRTPTLSVERFEEGLPALEVVGQADVGGTTGSVRVQIIAPYRQRQVVVGEAEQATAVEQVGAEPTQHGEQVAGAGLDRDVRPLDQVEQLAVRQAPPRGGQQREHRRDDLRIEVGLQSLDHRDGQGRQRGSPTHSVMLRLVSNCTLPYSDRSVVGSWGGTWPWRSPGRPMKEGRPPSFRCRQATSAWSASAYSRVTP